MSSPLALVVIGMGMGVVHVLTGPDHLSALATLSANVGNFKAFQYGVRWGVGHSIGLVLVGSIFIIFSSKGGDEDEDDSIVIPEVVESVCETFVGIFMLLLGIYGIVKSIKKNFSDGIDEEMQRAMMNTSMFDENLSNHSTLSKSSKSQRSLSTSRSNSSFRASAEDRRAGGTANASFDNGAAFGNRSTSLSKMSGRNDTSPTELRPSVIDDEPLELTMGNHSLSFSGHSDSEFDTNHDHDHDHDHLPNMQDGKTKQLLSICIGIVHGVAGPGGVLGVIPAVQLHDAFLSTLYLGTFCVTSTLTMGCYAALYGSCTARISASSAKFEFCMELFSACLSIFVGIVWLTLIHLGILHDIFP